MKKKVIFCLLFMLSINLMILVSCKPEVLPTTIDEIKMSHDGSYQKISSKVAKAYIDMANDEEAINNGTFIILDVRTPSEFNEEHIPQAINIPNESIQDQRPAVLPKEDAIILVYCRSGNRSAQASKKLLSMGYRYVFDFGGINSWEYETIKS